MPESVASRLWVAAIASRDALTLFMLNLKEHDVRSLESIGAGGEASVYAVPQKFLGVSVVLRKENDSSRYEELHAYAKKTFDESDFLPLGVIRLFAIMQTDSALFSIMERYEFDLKSAMPVVHHLRSSDKPEDKSLYAKMVISVFFSLIAALSIFAKAKVSHGDIKPENIGMMQNLEARVADYGLLRSDDAEPLAFQGGTCAYFPPDDEYKSHVSDMWPVGFIILEMMGLVSPSQRLLQMSAHDSKEKITIMANNAIKDLSFEDYLTQIRSFLISPEEIQESRDDFVVNVIMKTALFMLNYDAAARPPVHQLNEMVVLLKALVTPATEADFKQLLQAKIRYEQQQRRYSTTPSLFSLHSESGFLTSQEISTSPSAFGSPDSASGESPNNHDC